jgi:hypothetical protein
MILQGKITGYDPVTGDITGIDGNGNLFGGTIQTGLAMDIVGTPVRIDTAPKQVSVFDMVRCVAANTIKRAVGKDGGRS